MDVADAHGCFSVVDDAHGFGVLGREGRGTVDHFKLNDRVDVICGSLSKSLASTGGFVAASSDVIEYLRSHSKQTIFSAALSPSQAACAEAALEIMQSEPQHLKRLWENTRRYREMLKGLGLDIWESETPAVPIVLGSKERVYMFWRALLEKNIFTVMSISPAVPAGNDLIRTAISAMHTDEQIDKIGDAVAYALKRRFEGSPQEVCGGGCPHPPLFIACKSQLRQLVNAKKAPIPARPSRRWLLGTLCGFELLSVWDFRPWLPGITVSPATSLRSPAQRGRGVGPTRQCPRGRRNLELLHDRGVGQDGTQGRFPCGHVARCDREAAAGIGILAKQHRQVAADARHAAPERFQQRQAAALGQGRENTRARLSVKRAQRLVIRRLGELQAGKTFSAAT